jgi:hypothetical protein
VADEPSGTRDSEGPPRRTFTFKRTFTFGKPPPVDDESTLVRGPVQRFEWRLGGPPEDATPDDDGLGRPPATYYEALTGRPDPNREFFVSARRWLNRAVTLIALAIPVVLVAIGIVARADLQTIVLLAIVGAGVGLMLKTTFPKTHFG